MTRARRRVSVDEPEECLAVIRFRLPESASVDVLHGEGIDLCECLKGSPSGDEVHAAVTVDELAALNAAGFEAVEVLWTRADWRTRVAERKTTVEFERRLTASNDRIRISRAVCALAQSSSLLHVKARTSAGAVPSVILTASWDSGPSTALGSGGTATLVRLTRGGRYAGHAVQIPVVVSPSRVVVTSSLGGSAETMVAGKRQGAGRIVGNPSYAQDFNSHYTDPTELYERVEALAREFPDMAEMVTLPYETDGYRRPAQAVVGGDPDSTVVVTSRAWGHEGGNALSVLLAGPEAPNQPLDVAIDGDRIAVRLETDGSGKAVSTAAQVAEALNRIAGVLIMAQPYRGYPGAGIMVPQSAISLTDHLAAPQQVARAPFQMRTLRIGKHRDGSRPGILAYAQEHAREWVTPLIIIEVAERLLRNYAQDPATRLLVDDLDLFLVPSANPDGAHFSFYDYAMQRKNMVFHTEPDHAAHSAPDFRNFWGTDPNRNYGVGSAFDGYVGASANCLSQVYAGTAEFSEAESRNLAWLVDEHPNIRYATNIHSYGGYLMWPPGAAKAGKQEGLDRPNPDQEALFRAGAERMAAAINKRRGTVITADRIGAGIDVLYSAAGDSADYLWYEKGVFAWSLEVGVERSDSEGRLRPVGFQPPFSEGREESLEFAEGLLALFNWVRER